MRRLSRQDGQGLVEFAVVFPIFIFLVFMMIDGGLLMGRYSNINHAANEGARLLAVAGTGNDPSFDPAEVRERIKDQAHGLLDGYGPCGSGAPEICLEWGLGPNGEAAGEVGSTVKVTLKYQYDPLTPIPGFNGIEVDACAVGRLERPFFFDNSVSEIAKC